MTLSYIFPMRNEKPLQENWFFEKMRFKHSVELSKQAAEMEQAAKGRDTDYIREHHRNLVDRYASLCDRLRQELQTVRTVDKAMTKK